MKTYTSPGCPHAHAADPMQAAADIARAIGRKEHGDHAKLIDLQFIRNPKSQPGVHEFTAAIQNLAGHHNVHTFTITETQ